MSPEMRDPEAVRALRPLEVASYLRSRGWTQQPAPAKNASVWTTAVGTEEFEAVVPLDTALADYALRMAEVVQAVAVAETRPQAQVYADLLTTFADVVRIRIDDPDLDDGSLPIEAHAQVAQRARDLLLAAACAAIEKRAVWHTRKPAQAVEQVRKIRVGQTERGSYVVTVISRVSPALQTPENGQLLETEPPFERRVIETLASSLQSLDEAAESAAISGKFASFDEAIAKGVSANLCDAVAGFWGDESMQRNLDFTFSWSPARRVESGIPSRVRLASDRIPLVREAARVMRDRAPVPDFEVSGAVVKLDRPLGQPTGRVTVIGLLDGRPKRVAFDLGDPDYHVAVQAHDQEKALRCVGVLSREGRTYVLRDVCEVRVEEA